MHRQIRQPRVRSCIPSVPVLRILNAASNPKRLFPHPHSLIAHVQVLLNLQPLNPLHDPPLPPSRPRLHNLPPLLVPTARATHLRARTRLRRVIPALAQRAQLGEHFAGCVLECNGRRGGGCVRCGCAGERVQEGGWGGAQGAELGEKLVVFSTEGGRADLGV